MAQRGVDIPITAEDRTRAAFASAARNAERLDQQLAATGRTSQRSQRQFRAMRGGLGQLGFQIQDIAVQLQGGQNAMLVFSQQGSQIASIFGPGGIVIGALLAVGGAIGTALVPRLFDATDAAGDLETALEGVERIATIADDGILTLSDAMETLAKSSREAVGVQLSAGVIQAEAAVSAAVAGIGQRLEAEFGGFLEPSVQAAVDQFREAEAAGIGFADVMRAGMVPATLETERLRHEVGGLKDEILEVSDAMGISAQEAYGLIGAYAEVQAEASQENISAFLDTLVDLGPATGQASGELRGLQSELITAQQQAEAAAGALEQFRQAQTAFSETGELPRTGGQADVEEQNRELYIQGLMRQLEVDRAYGQESSQIWSDIAANRATAARQILTVTAMQSQQMATLVDEQSAAGKAFFVVQQTLGAASAVISGLTASMAIQESYAKLAAATGQPWLVTAGTAHANAARVMGFATAGLIMAQTVASFEGGGFTGLGPRSGGIDGRGGFPAILHPNEVVTDLTRGQAAPGMSGQAETANVAFHIQTNDSRSFGQLLQQHRGVITGIVRQAMNARGKRL